MKQRSKRKAGKNRARLYRDYLEEQHRGERTVFVGTRAEHFCGYVTVKWMSQYTAFQREGIPEINDLNVLAAFQRRGVATRLIEAAEDAIFDRGPTAGLAVGLTSDYGPAQRLYFKLGYQPDGRGLTYENKHCEYGTEVRTDDDLVLWLTKKRAPARLL